MIASKYIAVPTAVFSFLCLNNVPTDVDLKCISNHNSIVVTKWNLSGDDGIDYTNLMNYQPVQVQKIFACIRHIESRDHLVDTNVTSNAQGWYQFMPYIWHYARNKINGLPATPNQANGAQQSKVALWFYYRNHGIHPEWYDAC